MKKRSSASGSKGGGPRGGPRGRAGGPGPVPAGCALATATEKGGPPPPNSGVVASAPVRMSRSASVTIERSYIRSPLRESEDGRRPAEALPRRRRGGRCDDLRRRRNLRRDRRCDV